MIKTILSGLVLAAALPVGAMAKNNPTLKPVNYSCGGGADVLRVIYVDSKGADGFAIVLQMEEMLILKEARTGSGFSYKAVDPNYSYELAGKGDRVTLSAGGKPVLTECKAG